MIHDHTGYDFDSIYDLPIDKYMYLLREAYIYKLNQTESGAEYLEKCWIFEQSKPDRKTLREKFMKGGNANGG